MTIRKRKKATRFRAKTTHGYGSMKKNRGAGNKGGKGNAGSGKRAASKKPSYLKKYGGTYLGKKGFTLPAAVKKESKIITLAYIDEHINKVGKKDGDTFVVDTTALGFTKVLANGKLSHKIKLICHNCSKRVEEKVQAANGTVQR